MRTEILAPAGSYDALVAAVRSGANAVYFGAGNFNARRNAENFGGELEKAVEYCHLHLVKCYITLNTLVGDDELDELKSLLKRICNAKADALILQDLGVAKIAREICPDIKLHASTQLSTGTLEGLELLKKSGFSRAVLPRELSEKEIKHIAKNAPLELEMFVHGALCMSVSGQCLLSAVLGSRSGNRGLCAQPCRLPFSIDAGTGNDLSLKDLSLVDKLTELSEMGIASFKIEGRMKRPEYVCATVLACRDSLNGEYDNDRREDLKSLFSRSGFTQGYYEAKLGKDMFGYRQKENVTAATNQLLKKYEKMYEKETSVHGVDFEFYARNGERSELTAKTGELSVSVKSSDASEKAISFPLTAERVEQQLSKCGGTVFFAENIKCDISNNINIPSNIINSMRREALDKLSEKLVDVNKYKLNDFKAVLADRKKEAKKTYLCFYNTQEIPEGVKADRIFLPIDEDESLIRKYNAGVMLPRGVFGNSLELTEKLLKCSAQYVLCNTLDAVAIAKNAGKTVIGGPFLNIYNSISLSELEQLDIDEAVLSYELTLKKISNIKSMVKRGCVVYGRIALMLTRNCPVKNAKTCAQCKKSSAITDRKGIEFPIVCQNGFSELLNSRPVYMLDRMNEIKNTDFDMLVFTTESKKDVQKILKAYKNGFGPDGEFTRGLYYRGVE